MYFGSKADLYVAVNQKVWSEIDQERRQLLQAALTKQPSGPQLSDIVYALALPVVARALSHSKHDAARVMILRRPVGGRLNADVGAALEDAADRSIVRWIDSIAHSCPTLSRQDVVWAYSFHHRCHLLVAVDRSPLRQIAGPAHRAHSRGCRRRYRRLRLRRRTGDDRPAHNFVRQQVVPPAPAPKPIRGRLSTVRLSVSKCASDTIGPRTPRQLRRDNAKLEVHERTA